jgi:hypothetical protein
LTSEAGAFFASAISEQNFAFARSLLASGAGDLGRSFSCLRRNNNGKFILELVIILKNENRRLHS